MHRSSVYDACTYIYIYICTHTYYMYDVHAHVRACVALLMVYGIRRMGRRRAVAQKHMHPLDLAWSNEADVSDVILVQASTDPVEGMCMHFALCAARCAFYRSFCFLVRKYTCVQTESERERERERERQPRAAMWATPRSHRLTALRTTLQPPIPPSLPPPPPNSSRSSRSSRRAACDQPSPLSLRLSRRTIE